MGSDREPPEARWARLRSGEYWNDPETRSLILWEQWEAAGEDHHSRFQVGELAVVWLIEELSECARTGRMFLDAMPDDERATLTDEASLNQAYRNLYVVFGHRFDDNLRRAVSAATRCLDGIALGYEVAAAVPLAELAYAWLAGFRDNDRPPLIAQAVERFDRAARVLSEATGAARLLTRPGHHRPTAEAVDPGAVEQRRGLTVPPEPVAASTPQSVSPSDGLNPGTKAVGAAYQLQKEGKPISLSAACAKAGVDRKNVGRRYPEAVKAIMRWPLPIESSAGG